MGHIEDTQPIDVLAARVWSGTRWYYPGIERMARELKALRAECKAWRAAAETLPKKRSAPDHDHEIEGRWDFGGSVCEECGLWIAADEAMNETDAVVDL